MDNTVMQAAYLARGGGLMLSSSGGAGLARAPGNSQPSRDSKLTKGEMKWNMAHAGSDLAGRRRNAGDAALAAPPPGSALILRSTGWRRALSEILACRNQSMSIELLVSRQNRGWRLAVRPGKFLDGADRLRHPGSAWPPARNRRRRRGLRGCARAQRPDGGWPPQAGVRREHLGDRAGRADSAGAVSGAPLTPRPIDWLVGTKARNPP